jgi:hypothetical protein
MPLSFPVFMVDLNSSLGSWVLKKKFIWEEMQSILGRLNTFRNLGLVYALDFYMYM